MLDDDRIVGMPGSQRARTVDKITQRAREEWTSEPVVRSHDDSLGVVLPMVFVASPALDELGMQLLVAG